jgi:hypothetical protein
VPFFYFIYNYFLDALTYTEQIQNKLELLKSEEKQINDDLAVFEIRYVHSNELGKLQEVSGIH